MVISAVFIFLDLAEIFIKNTIFYNFFYFSSFFLLGIKSISQKQKN